MSTTAVKISKVQPLRAPEADGVDKKNASAAHLARAVALHLAGKREAGIDFMRRALAVDARNADCHFNLAKALQALGRLDEAALHFGETIAIRRDEGAAHLGLAEVRTAQGLLDAARQSYQRALAIDPSALDAHYGLANIALIKVASTTPSRVINVCWPQG
jgi:tetratricopeptide (TPR) repeat protein